MRMRVQWLVPRSLGLLLAAGCGHPSTPGDASDVGGSDAIEAALTDTPAGTDVVIPPADSPAPDVSLTDAPPATDGPAIHDAGPPPPMTCALPIMPADVTHPTRVVGTGSAASCTENALRAAIQGGGVVTFNCGTAPVTITIAAEITVPSDRNTVIDGGGTITLDGGGHTRILHYSSGDYRGMFGGPQHVLTVQNIAFANASATGTMITVPGGAPAACSRGINIDGGGGAILVQSGVLHVINATFLNTAAAGLGPDVAGGGVYGTGSTDVTIVGSRFVGNTASNGGAVGSLNSDLTLVNDTFEMNRATGVGANSVDPAMCPSTVNNAQVGSGGNGGAVVIDGGSDGAATLCGCTFSHNTSGALGGALFRTPDNARQTTVIDQTTMDGNQAPVAGGGAIYVHNSLLRLTNSTISNNSAPTAAGIQADGTVFEFTNDTFTGNTTTRGVGGAMALFSGSATLTNCTLAGNEAHGMNYAAFAGAAFGGPFVFDNCLIANNSDNDNNGQQSCARAYTQSQSVQWPQTYSTGPAMPCGAGIAFGDPMLGGLANNGGPTLTMAPSAAAAVVQIGMGCPATDQAGHARAMPCTVGALERAH